MMDILDLFNDGTLEAAEFQNVKVSRTQSEEELKKWTTEENLPEGRKALLLLTKGFALQKVAVLNNIHRLIKEREFADILAFTFVSSTQRELPTWEESLQVEAGSGFLSALARTVIPSSHLENLLKVTLALLSTWSAPVHAIWLQVFSSLLKLLTVPVIKKHCVPVALHLGEFSQAVTTRIVATQIIGMLVEYLQGEFRGEILQKSMMLAQDTSYEIRKSMCTQLKKIARCVSDDLQSRVFPEVLKLVNDEEIEVKREAVSLLIDITDLFPFEYIQGQIMPVLRSDLLVSREPIIRSCISESFGMLIVKMEAELQDEDFRRQCIDYYRSLVDSDIEKERKSAAFNFPAVLATLGASAFTEDLKPLYERLSRDASIDVKTTIAVAFHEVVRLVGRDTKGMSGIFVDMLGEGKLVAVLIKNLAVILRTLGREISPGQMMSKLVHLISCNLSWRALDMLLSQLQSVFDLFPLTDLVDKLQPVLLDLYPKACLPTKVTIAKLLCELIHRNYLSEKRSELCATVCTIVGNSSNGQDRIVFVEFCVRMLALNSRRFFQRQFLEGLLRVGRDPVKNVRLKVAMNLVVFHSAFCTQEEMQASLNSVIASLQSDPDHEISKLAGELQQHTMSRDYWNSVQSSEKDELEKQRYEELQDERELRVASR